MGVFRRLPAPPSTGSGSAVGELARHELIEWPNFLMKFFAEGAELKLM